jgi:alanine racemase
LARPAVAARPIHIVMLSTRADGVIALDQFMMRPGAALYGINPTPEASNPMQPVIEFKARIVQIRDIERGDTVDYGRTWTTNARSIR